MLLLLPQTSRKKNYNLVLSVTAKSAKLHILDKLLRLVYNKYMENNTLTINNIVPHVLTYPRSGMHFFDDMLYEKEKIHFTKSHFLDDLFDKNNNKQRVIITIARDPIDSICSYLALPNMSNSVFALKQRIADYVFMYSFLYDNADYVIDFNDLIAYPDAVIKKILSLLNIDKDKYTFFDRDEIIRYEHYVDSSKILPNYEKNLLDNFNTDLCYFYYNKLLEKKIII
jgi:hypothetical protein